MSYTILLLIGLLPGSVTKLLPVSHFKANNFAEVFQIRVHSVENYIYIKYKNSDFK